MQDLNFPFDYDHRTRSETFGISNIPLPSVEDILAAIDGPVTMSRWKDGSGFSAFDADVNEDYPHRANDTSLKGALTKLWLLKKRPIDEEFFDL